MTFWKIIACEYHVVKCKKKLTLILKLRVWMISLYTPLVEEVIRFRLLPFPHYLDILNSDTVSSVNFTAFFLCELVCSTLLCVIKCYKTYNTGSPN
jgi:hypothetical protein